MPRIAQAKLNPSQVLILQALVKGPKRGMTREGLSETVGIGASLVNLGPVHKEGLRTYPESLYAMGLVKAVTDEVDGKLTTLYQITLEGREQAMLHTALPVTEGIKVPPDVLDRAVRCVKGLKTYQFELYTDFDIQEIRDLLGEQYSSVPLNNIRQQIVTRRKLGAFAEKHTWPEWYIAYRKSATWTRIKKMVLEQCESRCALTLDHTVDVDVYHRLFVDQGESIIGCEEVVDLTPLCKKCWERNRKQMAQPPAKDPR